MHYQEVYFYYENIKVTSIKCYINFTVRKFLDKVEKKIQQILDYNDESSNINFKDIHCVYLKGRKLLEECIMKDYLKDLIEFPIYITNDSTKIIERSVPYISIDYYEQIFFFDYYNKEPFFKTIDKRTGKEVMLSLFHYYRVKKNFHHLYRYQMLSSLDHPGIIKFYGFRYPLNVEKKQALKNHTIKYFDLRGKEQTSSLTGYVLVFESVKNINFESILKEYLDSNGMNHDLMNPTKRSKIIYGVASIMKYLHHKRIVYNNLKIENILLDENYEPKIINFNKSSYIAPNQPKVFIDSSINKIDKPMKNNEIPIYMAPELYIESKCNLASDVYSFAFFLYKMFSNKVEFQNVRRIRSPQQYINKIDKGFRPIRPNSIPDRYWDLIQRCWKFDPNERPTFDEIVEELKYDDCAIEEFGMKTNFDELHDYQERMDSFDVTCSSENSNKRKNETLKRKQVFKWTRH